jgi:hypothetical protein
VRSGFGPRFVVEALFLVAVATVAALAQFRTEAIILVMVLAWILVAAVEWTLARPRFRRRDDEDVGEVDGDAQHVRVLPTDPEPTAQPVIERRAEPTPEPDLDAPPVPEPVPPVDTAPAEPTPAVELPASAEPPAAPDEANSGATDDAHAAAPEATAPQAQIEPERDQRIGEEQERTAGNERVGSGEPGAEHDAESEQEGSQEPAPEPQREPTPLAVVPDLERPPEPEPEPRDERVVALPLTQTPREWNLWELDRLARARAGVDAQRDEEWSYLLMYLREFASTEGTLPVDFDPLVRESFGELLETR